MSNANQVTKELRFTATEICSTEQDNALICGASNAKSDESHHYIIIQGWAGPSDEHRLHFEIDDQINGDYDLIAACSISRNHLTIDLQRGVSWYPELRRIEVAISNATDAEYDSLLIGLRRVFHDCPDYFTVAP